MTGLGGGVGAYTNSQGILAVREVQYKKTTVRCGGRDHMCKIDLEIRCTISIVAPMLYFRT